MPGQWIFLFIIQTHSCRTVSLDHVSHGLLGGRVIFPIGRSPQLSPPKEGTSDPQRIHSPRAEEGICVVPGLRTAALLLSECKGPCCILSAASARGGGRWGGGGLGLRTCCFPVEVATSTCCCLRGNSDTSGTCPGLSCWTCLRQSRGLHSQEGLCKIPRSWFLIVQKTQLWCVDSFL